MFWFGQTGGLSLVSRMLVLFCWQEDLFLSGGKVGFGLTGRGGWFGLVKWECLFWLGVGRLDLVCSGGKVGLV